MTKPWPFLGSGWPENIPKLRSMRPRGSSSCTMLKKKIYEKPWHPSRHPLHRLHRVLVCCVHLIWLGHYEFYGIEMEDILQHRIGSAACVIKNGPVSIPLAEGHLRSLECTRHSPGFQRWEPKAATPRFWRHMLQDIAGIPRIPRNSL